MRRNVKFFLYKALIYVVTFFLVLIVNFILPRLAPGNIAAIILSKFLRGVRSPSPLIFAEIKQLEASFGVLPQPLYV